MRYHHLLDLPYHPTKQNCFSLVRSVYADNYDIDLPNYAIPVGWWEQRRDLLRHHAVAQGFKLVDPGAFNYEPGDVLLIAKGSIVANHLGIYLPNGHMLHHLLNDTSRADPFLRAGFWKSMTVAVFRHPLVEAAAAIAPSKTVEMWSVLPEHARQRLADQGIDPEAVSHPPG
jgi:cell wall-associated NlpC family hydrolase